MPICWSKSAKVLPHLILAMKKSENKLTKELTFEELLTIRPVPALMMRRIYNG